MFKNHLCPQLGKTEKISKNSCEVYLDFHYFFNLYLDVVPNHCMNILHSIHQTVVANPVRDEKPKIINAKKLFSSKILLMGGRL
jgi:hypothetical protein